MSCKRVALFGPLVAAIALAACSSRYSADELPGSDSGLLADAPSDAARADIADVAVFLPDASEDGGDAALPENLLVNGDFEIGCAAWSGSNASLQAETSDVRTGKGACRVCSVGPNGYYIQQTVTASVAKGHQLTAAAWLKLPKDKTIMRVMSIVLLAGNEDGIVDQGVSTGPLLSKDGYQVAQGILAVDKDGVDSVILRITTDSSPETGECFLVDDASLVISN